MKRCQTRPPRRLSLLLGLLFACPSLAILPRRAAAEGAGVVVITEIMYHPRGGGQDLEYIELYNATPAPVDLSNWHFTRGIEFTFPPGTWLNGFQYLVVCANEERVREVYGITNTIGNWGRDCGSGSEAETGCALANGGETIELVEEPGIVAARVTYNDRGKWPAGADGTGHSLAMRTPYAEQDDPDSWTLSGELGGSPGRPNETEREVTPVLINEGLTWTEGERWVELFNTSETEEVDLTGFYLSDERANLLKAQFPEGTVIPPRGFLVVKDSDLGLDFTPRTDDPQSETPGRTFVVLTHKDGTRVVDAYIFEPEEPEASEARFPDGDQDFSDRAVPTPGEANRVDVEEDIVINEILYHPIDNNPSAEFVELYNRSDRAIDISGWSFTRGINYTFPEGTVMAPDSYIVVARDTAYIRDVYGLPASQVFGPDPDDPEAVEAFGRLRDDGERLTLRDRRGNIADTVRYHDGGQWPVWPDAGGPSLELIDPFQNNNVAASWDSSDESGKSTVQRFSYQGIYFSGEPEFHILLNHRGIMIVDNVRMVERTTRLEPIRTLIDVGEEWKYFKGTEPPSDPIEAWRQLDFDDSSWFTGATPIGFGEGDEATVLEDMRGNYITIFCRKVFELDDPSSLSSLILEVEYDDGFIAYLNGERVAVENIRRSGETIQDGFDARARSSREKVNVQIDLTDRRDLLRPGRNILAVQVHNASITSSDLRFIPRLVDGRFVHEDGPNLIQNGDFEEEIGLRRAAPGFWFIEGTHINSGRTTKPEEVIDGTGSLKVVATAKGDNKVNRLETTLPVLRARTEYTIELDARWVVGSPTFVTRGYNHDFARSHRFDVPRNMGTPGAPNSATLRRIDLFGSANLGPVISKVKHTPSLPAPGEDVAVTAKVEDSDGVAEVKLYWSVDVPRLKGDENVNEIVMEGPFARDRYRAVIPGQSARRRVVFYIEAVDAGGRTGRYPADQLDRVHPRVLDPDNPEIRHHSFLVYRHDTRVAPRNRQSYRFWMHALNEQYMSTRRLHSNDPVEGTFIFNNDFVYYNATTRFSGSPFARGGWGESFRVNLPKDKPLHGAIKKFNMEDHQRGGARSALERISNYLIRHNQGRIKVPYSFQWMVRWQVNDRVNDDREHVQTPNREFIQRWYPDDDDGDFFEVDDRHEFTDAGTRASSQDARLTYPPYPRTGVPPDDPENYRWYFNVRMNKGLDDYTNLIALAKIMTPQQTPNEVFDEVIWDWIDVEEFLRIWAIRLNTDDWDSWGAERGKNIYLYRPRRDGHWVMIPWDMELTYENLNAFTPPPITQDYRTINIGKFPEVFRLINRPRIKRLYYGIMNEMLNHQFNGEFLTPYVQRLTFEGMVNTDRARRGGWIDQRANILRRNIRSSIYPTVRLRISTNGGEPFSTEDAVVRIEGVAPVDIRTITVRNAGFEPFAARFSDANPLAWYADVPLKPGTNAISFTGTDTFDEVVDSTEIEVTFTGPPPSIERIVPDRARAGEVVAIEGSGFFSGLEVLFGGTEAEVLAVEPSRLDVRVPDIAPGKVDVVLREPGGRTSDPVSFEVLPSVPVFLRGDADASGRLSIADATRTLFHLFRGGDMPCADAADADDDGALTLSDALVVLNYLFRRGVPPAAPFPEPGEDPTPDELDCAVSLR